MRPQIWRSIVPSLFLLAASAGVLAAKDAAKADLPVNQVPPAVRDAARKAVDGIALTDAKVRRKKSDATYHLKGWAGGKAYELRVSEAGEVLKVSGGGSKEEGKRQKKAAQADAADQSASASASPANRVGTITHEPVRESSGIVASRRHSGVFWTHNDRGNASAIYAIAPDGKLLAEYPVAASADDWEDIAVDDAGHLYVANTGNNKATRDVIEVHRLAEPHPAAGPAAAPLRPTKTWRLRFPAAPFDCESLFVRDDSGFIVSKLRTGGPAAIYRFPLDAGDAVLEKVTEVPVRSPVTAADLSQDGRRLAILSGAGLHVFAVDGELRRAGTVTPELIAVPRRKLEGVCFAPTGIMMTAESREVYLVAH